MRRIIAFGPALVVLMVAIGALWAVPRAVQMASAVRVAAQVQAATQQLDAMPILEQINAATRAIATAVEPSVVHLDVRTSRGGSTGSGWVFDTQGHIITNAHVVRGARQVSVQFFDGLVVAGEVVGSDALTDVAVVKVDSIPGLFAARRAADVVQQQGDRVFAFGSPFGYKFSMSEGIISGLGRVAGPAVELGGFSNLIQTDAAVNPGNSGGPLVDVKGRVVGMNVAIATARAERGTNAENGQSAGISFAIPVSTVEYVAEQLIQNGRVLRGFLGLNFGTSGFGRSESFAIYEGDRFRGTGLVIREVTPRGPADAAGLRPGDVVTTISGQAVPSFSALRGIVGSIRPGQPVTVRVWRESKFIDSTVILGEMPATALVGNPAFFLDRHAGVQVDDTPQGVMVTLIREGSPFADAGFKPGTVILAVGSTVVRSSLDLAALMLERGWLTGDDVEFTILRNGAVAGAMPVKVTARLPDPSELD
ncbi:MAG: PDZ domain-containing protein [Tepidisphaera sp.]